MIAISCGSIIIRFTSAAGGPPLAIAAWRMTFATLLLAGPAWFTARDEFRRLTRTDLWLALIAGVFLAAHFATWITSLSLTSVASSVALVSTYPLFAALLSVFFLKERPAPIGWLGLAITMIGSVLIALADTSGGSADSLLGDALALTGGAMGAGYFLIGRRLRAKLSLLTYITLTYGAAALVLIAIALVANTPLVGYPPSVYALFLLLAIVPQLIGHSAFNWALRYLSATFVTVTIVGEPIGATLLALLLFGEQPTWLKIAAIALILVGIVMTSRSEGKRG